MLPENRQALMRYRLSMAKERLDSSQIRNNTDYADFFVVSEGEAEEQYERAQDFYKAIAHYLTERNTES